MVEWCIRIAPMAVRFCLGPPLRICQGFLGRLASLGAAQKSKKFNGSPRSSKIAKEPEKYRLELHFVKENFYFYN